MTREELHELVDIVMDAREKGIEADISGNIKVIFKPGYDQIQYYDYPTFSDFTQAVKDHVKSLER